jgi:hypothetical protein
MLSVRKNNAEPVAAADGAEPIATQKSAEAAE